MLNSEIKTFHESVKPLVYFNCMIGIGAFRLPNQKDSTYLIMKIYVVIFSVLNWMMIYLVLISISQILDFPDATPMALTMYKIVISVNSFIAVTAPLLFWIRQKGLQDCLELMSTLDKTFQSILGDNNEYKKQFIRLGCQIFAAFLFVFLVGICDTVTSLAIDLQMNVRSIFMFLSIVQTLHHPILVMLVIDLNYCVFTGFLEKKLRDMNECLLKLKHKPIASTRDNRLFIISQKFLKTGHENNRKNTEPESSINDSRNLLREIRRARSDLCVLSRMMNQVFGIQNLLSMGLSFVMITGLSYAVYSAFESHDFGVEKLKQVIPSAVWIAIYAFKIWIVNHSSWSVSKEAKITGEVIYENLNTKVADEELQKEIEEFGVQMLQNPIYFDACGFFTLNYTFIQGAIGSITTYLVILIQMSHSSETPTTNTEILLNNSQAFV